MAPNSCSSEEFSFPALVSRDDDSLFSGLDSPPLWKSHPQNDHNQFFLAQKPNKSDQRKSFSSVDVKNFCNLHKEEKMDMLWEDLNDDLKRSRSLKIEPDVVTTGSNNHNNNINNNKALSVSDDSAVNFGCGIGRSLKPEKKKPNMLVFMKVLKKLLLLRNSSHHRHKSPIKTHPRPR